jgi:hypothetical protein
VAGSGGATGGGVGSGGVLGTGGKGSGGASTASTGGRDTSAGTGGGSGGSSLAGSSGVGGRVGSGGTVASGGSKGTGGQAATGGTSGSSAKGGASGSGGASSTGGSTSSSTSSGANCNTTLPTPTGKTTVSATITVSGTKDYNMQQLCADPSSLGPGDQSESQKPVFMLAANAVLKNVIIGGSGCSAADGVHCESGSCTLENVWFGDVGEDAITFKGSSTSQVMTINGGGAFSATDKTIQHNGPGTIKISNFYLNNAGKLYRSCGNCGTQYTRHVVLDNVVAKSVKWLAGINSNYNDTATFTHITICGGSTVICEKYTGNDSGDEPTTVGSGPDGKNCIYTTSDITTM